jgi:hypothetical protein
VCEIGGILFPPSMFLFYPISFHFYPRINISECVFQKKIPWKKTSECVFRIWTKKTLKKETRVGIEKFDRRCGKNFTFLFGWKMRVKPSFLHFLIRHMIHVSLYWLFIIINYYLREVLWCWTKKKVLSTMLTKNHGFKLIKIVFL